MQKIKLIKLLATFEPSELRRFKAFVVSPYFNKNTKIQKLYDFILSFSPDFNSDGLCSENAFEYIFEGEEFKEQAVTRLNSRLYKLACRFISIESEKEREIHSELRFSNFMAKRGLLQESMQYIQQVQKDLDGEKIHDSQYFYERFLIEQELDKFSLLNGYSKIEERNLFSPSVALDKFYLLLKLMYLTFQISNQRKTKRTDYNFELMDQMEAYVPNSPYFEEVSIKIWYTILLLTKNENKKEHYFKLKELIFDHHKELNKRDLKNSLTYLQNNTRFVFENKQSYYEETFKLYKFQIEADILKDPLIFSQEIYINIVIVALLLEKLPWVENFLKKSGEYKSLASDDIFVLGKAMLAIAKKDFFKALDYLNESKYKNIYFKMMERRLRLKVYYELEYFDMLDDAINSFRKFLSKNKNILVDFRYEANRDFVNFMNQILVSQVAKQEKVVKLENEIKSISLLPEKKWLLKKVETILKK